MKAGAKATRSTKRNLFAELCEGMAALAEVRQGKRTLRTHAAEYKPAPDQPRQAVPGYGEATRGDMR